MNSQTLGEITDPRDGKNYRTLTIEAFAASEAFSLTWMVDNLNYQLMLSWCYRDKPQNCEKYGRLYHWAVAPIACPPGWHLPNDQEWEVLLNYLGDNNDLFKKACKPAEKGGLDIELGGFRHASKQYMQKGDKTVYWSSSAKGKKEGSRWSLDAEEETVKRLDYYTGGNAHYIRCVED